MTRLLIVTAVDAEREHIAPVPPDDPRMTVDVIVGGVGPVAAAAGTAAALAAARYDLVISAGIAGGFAPAGLGEIAVASCAVFADLGAETPDGFVAMSDLGFGTQRYDVPPQLAVELADRTGGHLGAILTVATVTGTAASADALLGRHPDAVAEAMEGAGVAAAATLHGVAFAEVRAISNLVGPRDRDAWQIPQALDALARAVTAICDETLEAG